LSFSFIDLAASEKVTPCFRGGKEGVCESKIRCKERDTRQLISFLVSACAASPVCAATYVFLSFSLYACTHSSQSTDFPSAVVGIVILTKVIPIVFTNSSSRDVLDKGRVAGAVGLARNPLSGKSQQSNRDFPKIREGFPNLKTAAMHTTKNNCMFPATIIARLARSDSKCPPLVRQHSSSSIGSLRYAIDKG